MNLFDKNLAWMNGTYEKNQIPKEHSFLKKYFKTKVQKVFLNYFYCMRDYRNFVDHTGVFATVSFLQRLAHKFEYLMNEYVSAKSNMDLDRINNLAQKKFRIPKKFQ